MNLNIILDNPEITKQYLSKNRILRIDNNNFIEINDNDIFFNNTIFYASPLWLTYKDYIREVKIIKDNKFKPNPFFDHLNKIIIQYITTYKTLNKIIL